MAFSLKQEFFRKLIHLSSFWIIGLIWLCPRLWAILLLSIVTFIVLVAEYETRKNSLCARIYRILFFPVLREKEKDSSVGFSGASYVLLAALILVIVVPKVVGMFALSVLLLSDTMAALVGRAMGRHRLIGKKTWEGTLAFLLTGLVVCLVFNYFFGLPFDLALMGVYFGCLGDLFNDRIHVDDNMSIPLLAALPFLF